jgi:hypothetical protein
MAIVVCLSSLSSVTVCAQSLCADLFSLAASSSMEQLRVSQKAWAPSNFTRPEKFDPKHFRFIVHAGPNVIESSGDRDALEVFLERAATYDFNSEHFFSTSIVSEKQTATFSRAGFILEVPEQKIIAATSNDMRSCIGNCSEGQVGPIIDRFYKRVGLKDPQEILNSASHGTDFYNFGLDWTEVLINGRAVAPRPIRISGLFTHQDSFGEIMLTQTRLKMMEAAAAKMHLPMIALPPPEGSFVIKVRMTTKKREAGILESWGPRGIQFLQTHKETVALFEHAQAAGKNVTLVDESNGPPTIVAPPGFLKGNWLQTVFDPVISGRKTTYLERKVILTPAEQPNTLPPIEFVFRSNGVSF